MQFDIEEFYPLILKELLLKAINPFNFGSHYNFTQLLDEQVA